MTTRRLWKSTATPATRANIRCVLALASVATACAAARPADAWQESHEVTDEVTVQIEASGTAHFDHALTYRVVRGPLRALDIIGIEKNADVEKDVVVMAPDGREVTAQAEMREGRVLRVSVDDPRALMRGSFVFHVKYAVDLVAAQELVRDGAMWRLAWTAPVANEGFDGGRFTFKFPSAPTEPRAINAETGAGDESILATLHRSAEEDELELVRPHIAGGEAVAWTIRLDPRAFPRVSAPQLRPPPPAPPPPPNRVLDAAFCVALLALATAYALLVVQKDRAVAALCGASSSVGAQARALVPIAPGWRGFLAGAALAGGVALEVVAQPTAAAGAITAAVLLAAVRGPSGRAPARGPGMWLAIRPEEAFSIPRRDGHWLDIGARPGRIVAVCMCAVLLALGVVTVRLDAEAPYFVALDAVALLPLFLTGRGTQLPPDLARAHAPFLGALFRRLRRRQRTVKAVHHVSSTKRPRRQHEAAELRVVPWARIPSGLATPDELRLQSFRASRCPGSSPSRSGSRGVEPPPGLPAAPRSSCGSKSLPPRRLA